MDDKVSCKKFCVIVGVEDRPSAQDLYEEYLLSQYDDVGMFLANFRAEG